MLVCCNKKGRINIRIFLSLILITILTAACTNLHKESNSIVSKSAVEPSLDVILVSEANWEQLNPARGSKSPMAATLWGDRTGPGPGGFLLKPVDGFRSPPHIHNIAYRGVVISGTIHNDHPDSEDIYMPVGSYWTQPGGGVHITAAKGNNILAYIEVEDAFKVLPKEKAFQSDYKAVNIDASEIVWVNPSGETPSTDGPKVAYLWGKPDDSQLSGNLIKLPAGFTGTIRNSGSNFHAVVIQGLPNHQVPGETDAKAMLPGSYFGSSGELAHLLSCDDREDCVIYVRTEGKFDVIPAELNN